MSAFFLPYRPLYFFPSTIYQWRRKFIWFFSFVLTEMDRGVRERAKTVGGREEKKGGGEKKRRETKGGGNIYKRAIIYVATCQQQKCFRLSVARWRCLSSRFE